MAIYIVYPSAAEYWLRDEGIPYRLNLPMETIEESTGRRQISSIVEWLSFTKPVHVLVSSDTNKKSSKSLIFHSFSGRLPKNSFIPVSDYIYLSSPELCFLQAAAELPIYELVQLACNLCAIYVEDRSSAYGQRSREPVSTVADISHFLNKASSMKYVHKAKRAIRYASDRANSPMESKLATIAALPMSLGGYGLVKPLLNHYVELSSEGRELLGRNQCCCDMVWPKQRLILEYDSTLVHSRLDQIMADKARATALSLSGYRVLSITSNHVNNFRNIENLFMGVRSSLGMRTHKDRAEETFEKRWNVVQKLFFDSSELESSRDNWQPEFL